LRVYGFVRKVTENEEKNLHWERREGKTGQEFIGKVRWVKGSSRGGEGRNRWCEKGGEGKKGRRQEGGYIYWKVGVKLGRGR